MIGHFFSAEPIASQEHPNTRSHPPSTMMTSKDSKTKFATKSAISKYAQRGQSLESSQSSKGSGCDSSHPSDWLSNASSWESVQLGGGNKNQRSGSGFLRGVFGLRKLFSSREGSSIPNHVVAVRKVGGQRGEAYITKYWQNYDLSISEAPKLFSDAELDAAKRIRHGLEVFALRKRLQKRITARNREKEARAAVRVQAVARGFLVRYSLPLMCQQHRLRASVKREQRLFKRELRSEGFVVYLYRDKDGALQKVTLKTNEKLNGLCLIRRVAMNTASVPFIALKSCYAGYPKRDFPTKSMQARATHLPDKDKTFVLQVGTGKAYVFVAAEDINGPSQKRMVKGLQSIIDEVSSPDSFYFDSFGVLRRVTSSIFDERGNTAQRVKARRQWQERFIARQEGTNARREALFSSPETSARPDDLPDDGPS